jgi:hypothetical protein
MRDSKLLLLNLAAKDQVLQSIIDTLDDKTEQDIENLNYQPWIKKSLKKLRAKTKETRKIGNMVAQILANCYDVYNEDFVGEVVTYIGGEIYVKSNFELDLLVREGDVLFVTDKGVWVDNVFITQDKNKLLATIVSMKTCKFTEYKLEVKKTIEKRYFGKFSTQEQQDKPMFTIKKYFGEFPPET